MTESLTSLEEQPPQELVNPPKHAVGGRIEDRGGDWCLYAENGFYEVHAKYPHRTSICRIMIVMLTCNKIHIEKHGRWLYRVEDERHWEVDFLSLASLSLLSVLHITYPNFIHHEFTFLLMG